MHTVGIYINNNSYYEPWFFKFIQSLFPGQSLLDISASEVRSRAGDALKQYNAIWPTQAGILKFESESAFTMFLLRWS